MWRDIIAVHHHIPCPIHPHLSISSELAADLEIYTVESSSVSASVLPASVVCGVPCSIALASYLGLILFHITDLKVPGGGLSVG